MVAEKLNKALVIAKMYYNINRNMVFYVRGEIPYLKEMIKEHLAEAKRLPGGVIAIKMLGPGGLTSQLNTMEETW
jgi:membrane-bound ClpP family serine protease